MKSRGGWGALTVPLESEQIMNRFVERDFVERDFVERDFAERDNGREFY